MPGKSHAGIRAVLFDLDNTLYDREAAQDSIVVSTARMFPAEFRGISEESIVVAFRQADAAAVEEFNTGASLDSVRAMRSRHFLRALGVRDDISETFTRIYMESYAASSFPIAGAEQIVRALHEKYTICVVTNNSPETQVPKIKSLGIQGYLKAVICSEEIGIRKPDAGIFLAAAKAVGTKPENCLFVGDSYRDDVIGAKNAGMRACWFNPQMARMPARPCHDMEISRLEELLDRL